MSVDWIHQVALAGSKEACICFLDLLLSVGVTHLEDYEASDYGLRLV